MRIAAVLALLVATVSTARADRFVSPGFSVAYGSRGFSLGVEVSMGTFVESVPLSGGFVGGFEISPFASSDQPWGKLYGELEVTALIAGLGGGPAVLLGRDSELALQLTPYLAFPSAVLGNKDCQEPYIFAVPYYRFTSATSGGFHDVGMFGKLAWEANGHRDNECAF